MPKFKRANKSSVVTGLNNAPGGDGGVDADVQFRLGAPGAQAILDRKHGICCGITIAWIVGFCHKRDEAVNTTNFRTYFDNVLRFQGAYMKDNKGNVGSIDDLDKVQAHGLIKSGNGKSQVNDLPGKFPPQGTWGAYLGAWHHAIGIGFNDRGVLRTDRYYIMDPNNGLFKYEGQATFFEDLSDYLKARQKSKGTGDPLSYTFFKKA